MFDSRKKKLTAFEIAVKTLALRETPLEFCQNCRRLEREERPWQIQPYKSRSLRRVVSLHKSIMKVHIFEA